MGKAPGVVKVVACPLMRGDHWLLVSLRRLLTRAGSWLLLLDFALARKKGFAL